MDWASLLLITQTTMTSSEDKLLTDADRRTLPKLPLPRTLRKLKSSMVYFLTVSCRRDDVTEGCRTLSLSITKMLIRDLELVAVAACGLRSTVPGLVEGLACASVG